MGKVFYFKWEEAFIVWLQSIGNGGFLTTVLNALNNVFSFMGEELFAILVMGIVYWGLDKKKGARLGYAVIFSMICNNMIKNSFKRLRPFQSSDKITCPREKTAGGFSFPSAHSSSASSLYPTLAAEYKGQKWLRIPAVLVPLLIAVSRCYLGAHWPTDVIAGLALGYVVFALVEYVFPKFFKDDIYMFYFALIIGIFGFFFCKTDDFFTSYGMIAGFTLAILFDRKKVNFENTTKIPFIIMRTIGGGLVFLVVNTGLKTIFALMPDDVVFLNYMFRTIRYFVVTFLATGVYPMAFKPVEEFLAKKIPALSK